MFESRDLWEEASALADRLKPEMMSRYQLALLRAKRESSRANTASTSPNDTSANSLLKSSRSSLRAPDIPKSPSKV